MHRFFVDDAGFQGEVACLEETDARHARRVLRLRPGEEVVLMDGARRFRGEILDRAGEEMCIRDSGGGAAGPCAGGFTRQHGRAVRA